MLSDEGSLKGKGSNIMLPAKGSPFKPAADSGAAEAVSFEAPPAAPELSGAPDLAPEDLARLFPGSAPMGVGPDAEPVPAWANFAVEASSEETPEPQAAWANFNPSETASGEALSFEVPSVEGSSPMTDLTAPANEPLMSLEELAALNPSSHAEREGEGALSMETPGVRTREVAAGEVPPGARTMPEARTIAPDMAVPDRTVVGAAAVSGAVAFGGGGLLGHISEDAGPQREAYKRQAALKESDDLLKMFATDGRLAQRWNEVDALEKAITASRMISHKPAAELLDRLAAARNLLLNDRAQIEDAEREIAEVRFRWTRIEKIMFYEEPPWILGYVVVISVLVLIGFLSTSSLNVFAERFLAGIPNVTFVTLWSSIMWGATGGLTGALYALWRHVADKKDYDPEFALWYYTNPLMGLMLGAFIYVVVQAGVLTFLQDSPLVLYILAWAVGFQQNIAFRLVNNLLDRLVPGDDKKKEEPKEKPKPADSSEAPGT